MKIMGSIIIFLSLQISGLAFAIGGDGGHSIGFGGGYTGASQSDLNSWSSAQNAGGAALSGGYEFFAEYTYRFSSTMFAIDFRPSYVSETATAGGISNSMTAFLFYPLLRIYALENSFIHFYLQGGVGWGQITGNISYGGSLAYAGNDFGAMAGLGAEFCITDHQCVTIEGDARYHAIPRSLIQSATGTVTNLQGSVSHELEYNGSDVQNTLSGIEGFLAYTFKF